MAGALLGIAVALSGIGAAQAQVYCVLTGPSGKVMGEARTCSAQQSVFDASSRANAGAGQQVQCSNLQSSAALAICRRNGFKYLGPWAGPLTPPAGFNWARHTFTPQCEAFKQVSQVVTRRPGTVCPIAIAKVQFTMACGVVCER